MPAEAREQAPSALWGVGGGEREKKTNPSVFLVLGGNQSTPPSPPPPQGLSAPTTGQQTAYTQPETQPV